MTTPSVWYPICDFEKKKEKKTTGRYWKVSSSASFFGQSKSTCNVPFSPVIAQRILPVTGSVAVLAVLAIVGSSSSKSKLV